MKKRRRSLENLTEGQESALWRMLTVALEAAVKLGLCQDTAAAKQEWRRHYLQQSCGIASLSHIERKGNQFARVMAALQRVAGDGINWIIKADADKPAELVWHVRQLLFSMGIAEDYARGIARNACRWRGKDLPMLEDLSAEQLNTVVRILHGQGARIWHAQDGNNSRKETHAHVATKVKVEEKGAPSGSQPRTVALKRQRCDGCDERWEETFFCDKCSLSATGLDDQERLICGNCCVCRPYSPPVILWACCPDHGWCEPAGVPVCPTCGAACRIAPKLFMEDIPF